ncbi:hypothetical protein F5890DRAFT_83082 [Lentinula detonsa]|uniref:Monopolin complex subunit Csm1/Pcs1 C-terminal domain-containing protein n=1 Tax=Lentinula detonsa TaxID=2804962 RepID=A0AA38Q9M8_9AGAR|nr:hypothetical protein F5890DRAFT_83082 [Lentinula detonsa]
MSDDLGGYGTPPIIQPKSRVSRSQGNKTAGPSKPGPRSRQKPASPHHEVIDVEDDEGDENELRSALPVARQNHTIRDNLTQPQHKSAKGKGKARAQVPKANTNARGIGDADLPVVEESDHEMGGEIDATTSRSKKVLGEVVERRKYDEVRLDLLLESALLVDISIQLDRRFKREKQSREEVEQRCEDLTMQLEKIMRVRETEAEALMLAQKQQFEAEIAALERVNKELTTNLAKIEPLMRSGKTSVLQLLTREAADEENRKIENEVSVWRQRYEEAQAAMKERDQLLKERAQREKELLFELEVEKKNFLTFKAKTQNGSARPKSDMLGSDKPQTLQLVRLYEDSTNLLIVGLKPQRSEYLNLDDWTATCVFTYISSNNASKHSLNFMLTCRWERIDTENDAPVRNKNELHEMMYYEPVELDREPEEFIQRLQHMGTAFSFTRDQLALFLRTLYNTLDEALHVEDGEAVDDDGDVEIIE